MERTADIAYKSQWYKWPNYLQKNIQSIIRHSQRPRTVNGFGLFRCDLEGFMKVRKYIYNYKLTF